MRIGIIGNQNNNGFALLRHFRSQGCDARLILYSTDGVGENSHFSPEADSWEPEKWAPYITQTRIPDNFLSALPPLMRTIAWPLVNMRRLLRAQPTVKWFSKKDVSRAIDGCDVLIGSGVAPALLWVSKQKPLDIYFPYSTGIEYLGDSLHLSSWVTRNKSLLASRIRAQVETHQTNGLKGVQFFLSGDSETTRDFIRSCGLVGTPLQVPQIYPEKRPASVEVTPLVARIARWSAEFEVVIFCGTRQFWKEKRNDLAIRAIRNVQLQVPRKVGVLIADYGPDSERAKLLFSELGMESTAFWFPKCSRKEIFELLAISDFAIGEFLPEGSSNFGSTAWEALATGTPIVHGFLFHSGEYISVTGQEEPPMLKANNGAEIEKAIGFLVNKPQERLDIGRASLEWYQRWGGTQLASKWLELIEKCYWAGR